jgi:hypothetical protein
MKKKNACSFTAQNINRQMQYFAFASAMLL